MEEGGISKSFNMDGNGWYASKHSDWSDKEYTFLDFWLSSFIFLDRPCQQHNSSNLSSDRNEEIFHLVKAEIS